MPCICFCYFAFFLSTSRQALPLSAHGFSCGCWDWCELQGQQLQSVPDWICWRRESFGITPEISPSHSLPLSFSTQNNIQHSGIPNIKNVKSLTDVFLFSVCLFFLHVQMQHIKLIKLTFVHAQTQFYKQLGVMTSCNDFVKTGAHLSEKNQSNEQQEKSSFLVMTLNRNCFVTMICCLISCTCKQCCDPVKCISAELIYSIRDTQYIS